jgi:hypothetical protein
MKGGMKIKFAIRNASENASTSIATTTTTTSHILFRHKLNKLTNQCLNFSKLIKVGKIWTFSDFLH